MRILMCNWKDLTHPSAGGAEVYADAITSQWAASGHRVTLFTARSPGQPAHELRHGVLTIRAGGRLTVYRAARNWYRRDGVGQFDLVVDGLNTRPFGCAHWAGDTDVVALAHQVADDVWSAETPWPISVVGRRWLEPRWLAAYRDTPVLTVSPSSQRSLTGYGLREVIVVPVGLTPPSQPPTVGREVRPTIAFLGRLTHAKRPFHALEAHRLLRRRLPDARLWVIGRGPLEAEMRRRAGAGVTVFGRLSEPDKFARLAAAHALVVTSVREGWGLVVDEAAAVGTRTVGYDVPGLRDSVPAAGGRLVAPTPAALASTLCETLPLWAAEPASRPIASGARPWSEVAETVLRAATHSAEALGAVRK